MIIRIGVRRSEERKDLFYLIIFVSTAEEVGIRAYFHEKARERPDINRVSVMSLPEQELRRAVPQGANH